MILRSHLWQAEVWPEFGMNTVSLKYANEEILRAPDSPETLAKSPCVYGLPLQLPANRTADGRFSVNGKDFHLPINEPARNCHIHGSLCKAAFQLEDLQEDSVRAVLENRGEVFPLPFRLTVTYWLDDTGYHQEFCFRNTGEDDLLLCFGLHSSFQAKAFLSVSVGRKLDRDRRFLATGHFLPENDLDIALSKGFDPQGQVFSEAYEIGSRTAQMGRFRYQVSDNFSHWILWNPGADSGFFCVEPQCGAPNALNNGLGLQTVPPGDSITFSTHISYLK